MIRKEQLKLFFARVTPDLLDTAPHIWLTYEACSNVNLNRQDAPGPFGQHCAGTLHILCSCRARACLACLDDHFQVRCQTVLCAAAELELVWPSLRTSCKCPSGARGRFPAWGSQNRLSHGRIVREVALRVRGRRVGEAVHLAAALEDGRGTHAAADAHGDHAEARALAAPRQLVQQRGRAARACAGLRIDE